MRKITKKQYEEMLNEMGIPPDQIGYIPDSVKNYGSWLRRNDPVAFDTYMWDYMRG